MKLISFILFTTLVFTSCEKTLTYSIDESPLIVVNSLISSSDPIKVKLSKSIAITEQDTTLSLANATVNVYCNNVLKEELQYAGDGVYKSNFIPEVNTSYQIKVSSKELESVSSQTIVPQKPEIISFVADTLKQPNGSFKIRTRITIKDDEKIKNYYHLSFKGSYGQYHCHMDTIVSNGKITYVYKCESIRDSLVSSYFINNDLSLVNKEGSTASETTDAIFGNNEIKSNRNLWLVFSDQHINGTTHTLELIIDDSPIINQKKPFYVELKAINEDYYKYLKSKHSAENSNNTAFTEPIKVYNNITGGAGVFAAYSLAKDSVTTVLPQQSK